MCPIPVLLLLLLLPQAPVPSGDSMDAREGLRQVVDRAAAAHALPPKGLAAFTSNVESEITSLIRGPQGNELPTQVEQVAGSVGWIADGRLEQEVTGYRSVSAGLTISLLSLFRRPWVIGPLYGDRVPILFTQDSLAGSALDSLSTGGERGPSSEKPTESRMEGSDLLIHPFATDRADYYQFSGGDTALILSLPERDVPLIRVWVDPIGTSEEAFLFQGEILLDANRYEIVRMRGQILEPVDDPSPFSRLVAATLNVFHFLEVENAEWDGSFWLPHRQRIEINVAPIFSEDQVILRIVTAFSEIAVNPLEAMEESGTTRGSKVRTLRVAPAESLRGFQGWRAELGAATAEASFDDFENVIPEAIRPTGPPRLRVGTGGFSDALRFDRVEGLFTGLGMRLDMRDSAPGAFVGLNAGYAWAEKVLRGRVEAGLRQEGWSLGGAVMRRLTSTNDFPKAFGARPTIMGLFGQDDFDYVDRYSAEAHVDVYGPKGIALSLQGGAARDQEVFQHVNRGSFRAVRPVQGGDYAHVLTRATAGGLSGGEFLSPGLSAEISWEAAWGELNWHRVEGAVRTRNERGRWRLVGEIHGGLLLSERPPPQVLFELGSVAGRLPSFEYKAFSGDRAAISAIQVMWVPPWFETPLGIGPLFLPALAPSPVLELSTGWTGASRNAAAVMNDLGWTDSERIRTTLFFGVRLFGGAMGFGIARPLGEVGRWRFALGLAPG